MNNSLISDFMLSNNDWQKIIEDKGIKIKDDENYYIFNYGEGCDFFDPVVQEARGIIIDKNDCSVACVSFRKFGNYGEAYTDNIDWSSAKVQDKIDGSIVRCFYNKYKNKWQWATNGMVNAEKAPISSVLSNNFLELIKKADNYQNIPFNTLDKNKTYTFELISPENTIVVKYDKTTLYHIGTRNNLTLVESNEDIGIIKPKEYPLNSLEACLKAVNELNVNKDDVRFEGYVVVDKEWHRCKIKSPEYLKLHYFANGYKTFSKSRIIDIINNDDIDLNEVKEHYPVWEKVFTFYENEIKRVESDCQKEIDFYRKRFIELNNNRKEIAKTIVGNKYEGIIFKALGNNKNAKTLLSEITKTKYENLLNEFK